MSPKRRGLAESAVAALAGYVIAAMVEGAFIRSVQPTEWELASLSDVVLAAAFGVAVYLWRNLLATRHDLAERERAELVLETQLSMAADIQQRLLPAVPPASDGFELAASLRSAGKIGGDFYDFVETAPGVWLILVADVSGKGIPAAMALGSLRLAFRAFARRGGDPADVVTQLSAIIYQQWLGSPYVSCIVCTFDLHAGTLTYTNAGHPAGILAGPSGTRSLRRGGLPAGLLPDAQFDQERVPLEPGDVCLLVSDGVTKLWRLPQSCDYPAGAQSGQDVSAHRR